MQLSLAVLAAGLVFAAVAVSPSFRKYQESFADASSRPHFLQSTNHLSTEKTECETKRDAAEQLVKQQEKSPSLGGLAIVVPNCNEDGSYATLQCHHNSQFCQCWDKEGLPLTSPKKNLKKCSCLVDRAKTLKSIRK